MPVSRRISDWFRKELRAFRIALALLMGAFHLAPFTGLAIMVSPFDTRLSQKNGSRARSTKPDGLGTGGYTDKPWFLRIWDGMPATGWFRLLLRDYFHISPRRWAMAVLISLISLLNLGLGAAADGNLRPPHRSHATPGRPDLCDRTLAFRHDAAARIVGPGRAAHVSKHL